MMWRIRLFLRRLLRLVEWLPVIWEGDDYDYNYSINVFKYQLERTAKYIKCNGHLENGERVVLQIQTAVDLIDKTYNGGYIEQAEEEFTRQYGECEIQFHDYDEENFEMTMWWSSAEDSEHNDQINEFYHAHMFAAHAKAERGKAILWKYINKNIETWWD